MTVLLEARGVVKAFAPRRGGAQELVAVNGVDLHIAAGEVVGLVGESGSGKSTLARTLLHILRPDSGQIFFDGMDLQSLSPRELRALRGRMQMIHQSPRASLNPGLTVEQQLRETIQLHRPSELGRVDQLISEALVQVGLSGRGTARVSVLSGGEMRRVAIARALLPKPNLVVADEPTAGIDASHKPEILDLMIRNRGPDRALLFISHDLGVIRYVADRVAVMQAGRIVQTLRVQELDPTRLDTQPFHPHTERLLRASLGAH